MSLPSVEAGPLCCALEPFCLMLRLMTMRARRTAALVLLAALAGCGQVHVAQARATTCQSGGFAASLGKDTGGAPSPLDAAEWQAQHGADARFPLPADGWQVERMGVSDAEVRSGNVQLHAITGRDGTWFIDSGKCSTD